MPELRPVRIAMILLLAAVWAWPQSTTPTNEHAAEIRGVRIGMTIQQVLDLLEPLPYSARAGREGTVFTWNLSDGTLFEVTSQGERIVYLYMRYPQPLPTMDLGLESPATRAAWTAPDARLRREYHLREPLDKSRIIWARWEKDPREFKVEVGFVSVARERNAAGFRDLVEFKYLAVPKEETAKFEQALGLTPAATRESVAAAAHEFSEDHQPSIYGLRLGMTAQQVLHRLKRMPDSRKEEDGEVAVSWDVTGDTVEVRFRGEHVRQIGLKYREARPTTDLWLLPLSQAPSGGIIDNRSAAAPAAPTNTGTPATIAPGTGLVLTPYGKLPPGAITARDPRWRADYKPTESLDKHRTVWTFQEKTEEGYRAEIRFMSVSRERMGDRYEEYVEYKYLTVPREDLAKFDKVYARP